MPTDESLSRYRKKEVVTAIRLDLDTDGFTYRAWGATQRCKRGDWIVKTADDTYTIDAESFARTYREVSDGRYRKVTPVWAERAREPGMIETRNGATHYEAGDMLVYNSAGRQDGYAMSAATFDAKYELLSDD